MNQPAKPVMLAVPVNHGDHFTGSHTARVIVVEYGDFECPSCAQAYPAVKIMLKHFGDELRFLYPAISAARSAPACELAAEVAEAGAQHKFWPMHALLFENQLHLKANSLRQYAAKAELDLERYDYEMGDHVYLQRVQEHLAGGSRSGVRAPPHSSSTESCRTFRSALNACKPPSRRVARLIGSC